MDVDKREMSIPMDTFKIAMFADKSMNYMNWQILLSSLMDSDLSTATKHWVACNEYYNILQSINNFLIPDIRHTNYANVHPFYTILFFFFSLVACSVQVSSM